MTKRCLALALLLTPSLWAGDRPRLGAATPDELVQRLEAAANSGDQIALAALMTPRGRAEMSMSMTALWPMILAMQGPGFQNLREAGEGLNDGSPEAEARIEAAVAEFEAEVEAHAAEQEVRMEEAAKQVQAVFERYGVQPELARFAGTASVSEAEIAAFEKIDHLGFLSDMLDIVGNPGTPTFEGAVIGTPSIEGDRGMLPIGDGGIPLVRIDDRWYLSQE